MGGQFTSSEVLEVTWFACSLGVIGQEVVWAGRAGTLRVDVLVARSARGLFAQPAGSHGARGDLVVWACAAGTVVEELLSRDACVSLAGLGVLPLGVSSTWLTGTIGRLQNLVVRADVLHAGELAVAISRRFSDIAVSRAFTEAYVTTVALRQNLLGGAGVGGSHAVSIGVGGQLWACSKASTVEGSLLAASAGNLMAFVVLSLIEVRAFSNTCCTICLHKFKGVDSGLADVRDCYAFYWAAGARFIESWAAADTATIHGKLLKACWGRHTFLLVVTFHFVGRACRSTDTSLREELGGTFAGWCHTLCSITLGVGRRVVWAGGNACTIGLKELTRGTDGSFASLGGLIHFGIWCAGRHAALVAQLVRSGVATGVGGEEGTLAISIEILVEFWARGAINTVN